VSNEPVNDGAQGGTAPGRYYGHGLPYVDVNTFPGRIIAIEGTDDLLETYERIRARPNPDLKVLGVLITLFDKRTNISRDTHEQIRSVFGSVLFKTRIGKNVRLEESPAYKETIMSFAPKSPGARDYCKLGLEVIQRVEEDRIANHTEDAA